MGDRSLNIELNTKVCIVSSACIAGPFEQKGLLGNNYDDTADDEYWGESCWEKAESKFMNQTLQKIIQKAGIETKDIDLVLSGDLLNQCTATGFGFRNENFSVLGLYGACSTMAESICIGSMLVSGGFTANAVCITSSHFCSAEKQFRAPLELGTQRTPTSQRTVTGSGGVMLQARGDLGDQILPKISRMTIGKIVDMGITDANNMGAAMAPAAYRTIKDHIEYFSIDDYDAIYTGDLGAIGKDICCELLEKDGHRVIEKFNDCGLMVYSKDQDIHAGGSGCGCSAVVLAADILKKLKEGKTKRILFVGTGALLSASSSLQGESIPGVAHAVSIEI